MINKFKLKCLLKHMLKVKCRLQIWKLEWYKKCDVVLNEMYMLDVLIFSDERNISRRTLFKLVYQKFQVFVYMIQFALHNRRRLFQLNYTLLLLNHFKFHRLLQCSFINKCRLMNEYELIDSCKLIEHWLRD